MGLLGLLASPVLGGPMLVHWLAKNVAQETERRLYDEGPLREALLELQQRLDEGQISEAEYDGRERALLERLSAIREHKAHQREV